MKHRRSTFATSAAMLFGLAGALCGTALAAPAGGIKGDPQPEAKPFLLSKVDASHAQIAFEPDRSMVAVYEVPSGSRGKVRVCVLDRGKRSCAHLVDLSTPSSGDGWDAVYGPQVLVPSANHVLVLGDVCCDGNTNGDTLMYSSTDGGKSFGSYVRIGGVAVGGAVLIGNQIVFIGSDTPGVQVESVKIGATGGPSTVATLATYRDDVGIGAYKGGALAGYDNNDGTQTVVQYAPARSDFNQSSSYHKVITINKEQLLRVSGDAVLTIQNGGKLSVELRLFNGKSFGTAHTVPGTSGGGPEWWGMEQDPSGVTHVFTERGFVNPLYDLIEYSTRNGTRWSKVDLGNASNSYFFSAGLDAQGTGLILGSLGNQVDAYPVLHAQAVSFSLKSSNISKGQSTTASGKVSPAGGGRVVSLQVEHSGEWYDVAATHESSKGSFSFTIKGKSAGRFTYRAVASDLAGYLQYGYSTARSLRVS